MGTERKRKGNRKKTCFFSPFRCRVPPENFKTGEKRERSEALAPSVGVEPIREEQFGRGDLELDSIKCVRSEGSFRDERSPFEVDGHETVELFVPKVLVRVVVSGIDL